MFTFIVFEIELFEGKSVLGPTQRVPGSKRVKFSMKQQQKMLGYCWNCLKSDCLTSLEGFEWFLVFFIIIILFNPFSTRKIEKLYF